MPTVTEKLSALVDRGAVLGSQLDALANGSYTSAGAEYDNTSNLDRFGIAELVVDFVSAPTLNATALLYAIIAADGTNYEDGSSSLRPADSAFLGAFQFYNTTASQRILTRTFELRPVKMKFMLYNGSGQAFPASGSEVSLYTTNRTIG